MQNPELAERFEKQVRENEPLLHKVCRLYAFTVVDRQDLFQEIVIRLWQAYPSFRGEAKFSTWLYRVAINTAISAKRKQKDWVTLYEPANLPVHLGEQAGRAVEEERWQQLYGAIVKLNEVEKALVMLYLEDRSYVEMEEILGISEGTLRVKMNRTKEKLRHLTKTNQHGTR